MHSGPVTSDPPAIEAAEVTVDFPGLRALDGVSLSVPQAGCFGIVGESGSGKSTLLRTILGLQRPGSGQIRIEGALQPHRRDFRAQARVLQPIFQDPALSLSPRRRVGQSLDEVGEALGEPREALRERLRGVFDRLGLQMPVLDRYPHQISGGQARRVAIARALLFQPRVLIADEPTAGLDVSVQGDLLNLLQEIRAATGITLLIVSHNLAVVRLIADAVAVMRGGRIVEQGDSRSVFDDPQSDYTKALIASWPRGQGPDAMPARPPGLS